MSCIESPAPRTTRVASLYLSAALLLTGSCGVALRCAAATPVGAPAAAMPNSIGSTEKAPFAPAIRSVKDGALQGVSWKAGSYAWLGIPYAQPPVGNLRWRAPRAPTPWSGTLQATGFQRQCPQPDGGNTDNEDCLYLNVWSPPLPPERVPTGKERLPVMVWLHGGGNVRGSAENFDGGALAATQGVVVVAMNLRLGPLGWFRHAAFRGPDTTAEDASGNYGLLDVIAALRWVQANVTAFGGDPQRVTVFGWSAGAMNTYSLLTASSARGLFQRAIVQSGGDMTWNLAAAENPVDASEPGDPKSSSEALFRLLVDDGTVKGRAAARAHVARMNQQQVASYLRGKSVTALLRAYDHVNADIALRFPQLFRDGVVLPKERIRTLFERGEYNHVPLIIGTTRDEYSELLELNPAFAKLKAGGLEIPDKARYALAVEYLTNFWRADSVDQAAALLSAQPSQRVFTYRFDRDGLPPLAQDLPRGAPHGADVSFVFGLGRASKDALSAVMMSYWSEFAATGDPGTGRHADLPRWPASGRTDAHSRDGGWMMFNDTDHGGVRVSTERLTHQGLLQRLAADTRLSSTAEKCRFLLDIANVESASRLFGPDVPGYFTQHDLDTFMSGACKDRRAASGTAEH